MNPSSTDTLASATAKCRASLRSRTARSFDSAVPKDPMASGRRPWRWDMGPEVEMGCNLLKTIINHPPKHHK